MQLTRTDHCEAPDVLRAVGVEEVSLGAPLKSEDSKVDLLAKEKEAAAPLPEEEPKEEIEEVRDDDTDGSSSRSSGTSFRNEKHSERTERPSTPAPVVHV